MLISHRGLQGVLCICDPVQEAEERTAPQLGGSSWAWKEIQSSPWECLSHGTGCTHPHRRFQSEGTLGKLHTS